MRIMVTGGTGFIGKQVVPRLLEKGHELLLLSRKESEDIRPDKTMYLQGNLSDIETLEESILEYRPEALIHLAWEGIPDYGKEMSQKNLKNGLMLFEKVIAAGCKTIVGVGSCWEYHAEKGAQKEDQPIHPKNSFVEAKHQLHQQGAMLAAKKDVLFIWTRLFYVYGPGQDRHSLIPSIITAVKKGKLPDLKTPRAQNDFIYVEDVAEALVAIIEQAERLRKICRSPTYNIGSGKLTKVQDILKGVIAAVGADLVLPDETIEATPGFWADITHTESELKWSPQTSIEEGIKKSV